MEKINELNKENKKRELFVKEKITIKTIMIFFFENIRVKNSIFHYENDEIVLKDRITEFERLKKIILMKLKGIDQKIEPMKYNRVRCDISKFLLGQIRRGI